MSSLDLQEPKQEKQAAKGGVPQKVDPKKVGALQNLSRSDADLLSRSVVLEETDPPGGLRATLYTISVAVLVFVVWASLSEFDEYAVAEGEIIPVDEAQEVQHLEGGTIASLGCIEWEKQEDPEDTPVCVRHIEESVEVRKGEHRLHALL